MSQDDTLPAAANEDRNIEPFRPDGWPLPAPSREVQFVEPAYVDDRYEIEKAHDDTVQMARKRKGER